MCLAVPLEIRTLLDPPRARACQGQTEIDIDISLVPEVKPGDYVIVHAGFAIQVLETGEAEETLDLFRQMDQGAGDRPG
jgi:hydrogenase expression/formation protein HypC